MLRTACLYITILLCHGCYVTNVHANAQSEIDRNIAIIFPPDLMQEIIDQTTPEMMSNLKFTSEADKSKTQREVDQFHRNFIQNFNQLVSQSLKQNFTPQELAEWAKLESSPLGKKTMLWLKTQYPGILNKAMDAPMQQLYKSMLQ